MQSLGQPAYRAEQVFRWLHGPGRGCVRGRRGPGRCGARATCRPSCARPCWRRRPCARWRSRSTSRRRTGRASCAFAPTTGGPSSRCSSPTRSRSGASSPSASRRRWAARSTASSAPPPPWGSRATSRPGEIVEQVYHATALAGRRPTNIVFMGMGEPLHNLANVSRAFSLLLHPWGAAFSPRRITVSTVGLVSGIDELGKLQPAPNLAISLNATTDEVRSRIMPVNRRWPIEELLAAARRFPLAHGRRVTFEYVMLAGVNDSDGRRRPAAPAAARDPLQGEPHPLEPVRRPGLRAPHRGPHPRLPDCPARPGACPCTSAPPGATTSTQPAASWRPVRCPPRCPWCRSGRSASPAR